MSREIFLSHSDVLAPGHFILAEVDGHIENGQEITNDKLHVLLASLDGSLADMLITHGIIRSKVDLEDDKSLMIVTHPGIDVKL